MAPHDAPMHLILPGTATFLLGLLLTLLVRRGALRLGVVAVPKVDRWHRRQVAMLGGVAMAGAIVMYDRVKALALRVMADRLEHGEAVPGLVQVFSVAA